MPTMSTSVVLLLTLLSLFTLVDAHAPSSRNHRLRMERRQRLTKDAAPAVAGITVSSLGKRARVALAPSVGSFKSTSSSKSNNRQCTISVSAKTNKAIQTSVQTSDQNCADAASATIQNGSEGLLGCYKVGFVDTANRQFGAELSVWNVGSQSSTSDFTDTSLKLSWDNASFVTEPGSFVAASSSGTLSKVASFHFVSDIPAGFNSTDLSALTPTLSSSGAPSNVLGLVDVTALNSTSLTGSAWGLYNKEFVTVEDGLLRKLARFIKRQFIDLSNEGKSSSAADEETTSTSSKDDTATSTSLSAAETSSTTTSSKARETSTSVEETASSTSSANKSTRTKSVQNNHGKHNGNNKGSTVIVSDSSCTVIVTDSGIVISDGIIISGGNSLTITNGIVITETVTKTITTSKAKNTDKSTTTTTSDETTSTSVADTTTTEDSTTSVETTTSAAGATETGGVGVNVVGFGSSVDVNEISSVISSASGAVTTTAAADVTETSSSSEGSATETTTVNGTVQGALAQGTSLADTTTEATASSTPFQLPGRQLQVLPIGLGVFAGVSVLALAIVGVVTYERRKYRRQFRLRREQEQAAAGMRGMTEVRL